MWEVLTDFQRLSSWTPDVRDASLTGGVDESSVFQWKAGPETVTSTILLLERPRFIG